ncbi:MAG: hypothetical protein VB144_11560 [Clostridia bacterium]|nr:hypothetical protein [Clostridia bacterium]
MGRVFCLWIALGCWEAASRAGVTADGGWSWLLNTLLGFVFAAMAFDGLQRQKR